MPTPVKSKIDLRIDEAKAEAERFLKRVRLYEMSNPTSWPSKERAALKRSALDCGRAMSQVNKSNY